MKQLDKSEVRYLLTSHNNALVFVSPVFEAESRASEWRKKVQNKIDSGIRVECNRRPFASNSTSLSFVNEKNEIAHLYVNSWNSAFEYKGFLFLVNKYKDAYDKKPRIKFMVYKVAGI